MCCFASPRVKLRLTLDPERVIGSRVMTRAESQFPSFANRRDRSIGKHLLINFRFVTFRLRDCRRAEMLPLRIIGSTEIISAVAAKLPRLRFIRGIAKRQTSRHTFAFKMDEITLIHLDDPTSDSTPRASIQAVPPSEYVKKERETEMLSCSQRRYANHSGRLMR